MSLSHTAIFEDGVTRIITAAEQGPAGPPGPAVPAATPSFVAATGLIAFKVVALTADGRIVHADNTIADHAGAVLGLVLSSPAPDTTAAVQQTGEVTNPGWNWQPGQTLFLGTEGALITAPPAAPAVFSQPVALAIASDKVIVDIGLSINL